MKVKIISLIVVIIAFCSSCLSSFEPGITADNTDINTEPGDTDKYDFLSNRNITWLASSEDWVPVSVYLNDGGPSLGIRNTLWELFLNRKMVKSENDAKICTSVFISSSEYPNLILMNYDEKTGTCIDPQTERSHILIEIMSTTNPELYERHMLINASESKREGRIFTEEEINEANNYYEECMALAEQDERYLAVKTRYDEIVKSNYEKRKILLAEYLVYEKLFTDYGFEIAARYNDGGVLDRYLIDSQCPFAIIGTKEMIVDFVNNVIPEGREETTGMYFAFGELPDPKTIDP